MRGATFFRRRLLILAIAAAPGLRAEFFDFLRRNETGVNVVVDVTPEGKKLAPPTKEKPAIYFPLVAGYRQGGAIVAGEKSPPPDTVAKVLGKALATQHYRVIGPKTGRPSLLLVFHWGYLNPQIDVTGDSDNPQMTFWNQREMLALVAGNTLKNFSLFGFERDEILHAAREDRYFVIVSAYDFEAATQKKKQLLWQAKMSTPSNGVALEDVVPSLINAGAKHFGRETHKPQSVTAPMAREGKVEIGAPTVVPEGTPPAQPPAKKP